MLLTYENIMKSEDINLMMAYSKAICELILEEQEHSKFTTNRGVSK